MVQYSNGANGELRDIFIENGLMVYVTMYHNEIEASAKAKIIYRYLLRKVGVVVLLFVVGGAVLEEVGGRGGREKERLE